MQKAVINR